MNIRHRQHPLHVLAQMVIGPAILIAAAAISGTATAAETADTRDFRVWNATDQHITGWVIKHEVNDTVLQISLQPGEHASGLYDGNTFALNYTSVNICRDHQNWATDWLERTPGENWRDIYIFTNANGGLFLTPQGAHDDIELYPTASC